MISLVVLLLAAASRGSENPQENSGGATSSQDRVSVRLRTSPSLLVSWAPNRVFEILHSNRRCIPYHGGSPEESIIIWSGQVRSGFFECKQNCMLEQMCAFFALWKKGRCELYESCFRTTDLESQSPPGSSPPTSPRKITDNKIYKRLSECDAEINHNRGRYVKFISEAFPDNIVRYLPPSQNLHCFCVTGRWGVCAIFVVEDSEEEALIYSIVSGPRPPFMLNPLMRPEEAPIVFALPTYESPEPRVYAEIYLMHLDRCLHMTMCTDGGSEICPIMRTPFQSGEPVVILKSDAALIKQGKPVLCISLAGIMQISMTLQHGTDLVVFNPFRDPYNRNPEGRMDYRRDYDVYFLFHDMDYANGLCSGIPAAGVETLPKLSSLQLQEALEHGSVASDTSSLDSGSPDPFKKKTRRGGKKKKGSILPPSLEGSPEVPEVVRRPPPPPSILKQPPADAGSSSAADALLAGGTFAPSTSPVIGGVKKVQFTSLPENPPMRSPQGDRKGSPKGDRKGSPKGERHVSRPQYNNDIPLFLFSVLLLAILWGVTCASRFLFHKDDSSIYISFEDMEKG